MLSRILIIFLLLSSLLLSALSAQDSKPSVSIDEGFYETDKLIIPANHFTRFYNRSNHQLKTNSFTFFYLIGDGLFVRANSRFDYESGITQYEIPFTLLHPTNDALSINDTLLVFINDVNEAPVISIKETQVRWSYPENPEQDTFLFSFEAYDPENAKVSTAWSFADSQKSDNSAFFIRNDSLFVNASSDFHNYEQYPEEFELLITATDSTGIQSELGVNVQLIDQPEAPLMITLTKTSLNENPRPGSYAFSIDVLDEDFNESHEIRLPEPLQQVVSVEPDANNLSRFNVVISDSSYFNYEIRSEVLLEITAYDKDNLSITNLLRLEIRDINEKPHIVSLNKEMLFYEDEWENQPFVWFMLYDPDAADSLSTLNITSRPSFFLKDNASVLFPFFSTWSTHAQPLFYLLKTRFNPNIYGNGVLKLEANDGQLSSMDSLSFQIQAVNDAPRVFVDQAPKVNEGGTLLISTELLHASDIDNLPSELTLKIIEQPKHGYIFHRIDSSITAPIEIAYTELLNAEYAYQHDGSETTEDSWGFQICDLEECTKPSTQNFEIRPINDPPTFTTAFYPIFMIEDKPYPLRFGVQDADNKASDLEIIILPDRNKLIDLQASTVSGVDLFRTVSLVPKRNLYGKSAIKLGLTDAIDTTWVLIEFTIKPVNDPPLLQLSSSFVRVGNSEEVVIQAKYEDVDSPDESIQLKIGSTDPSLLPESRVQVTKIANQSLFELQIMPKARLTGFVDLIIECSDEQSATASVLQLEIKELNDPPMPFQLVSGESFIRNDSLVASFNWTPSYDPENLEVEYSLFLKTNGMDTVIHGIKGTSFEMNSANRNILRSERSYDWYVVATDNHLVSAANRIDSTRSTNKMTLITPFYEGLPNWAEIVRVFPNPFLQVGNIEYSLAKDAQVEIHIYDFAGKQIEQIENRVRTAGIYTVRWSPPAGSGGVYLCRLVARSIHGGQQIQTTARMTHLPR